MEPGRSGGRKREVNGVGNGRKEVGTESKWGGNLEKMGKESRKWGRNWEKRGQEMGSKGGRKWEKRGGNWQKRGREPGEKREGVEKMRKELEEKGMETGGKRHF